MLCVLLSQSASDSNPGGLHVFGDVSQRRHSSFPSVKPVRKFLPICLAAIVAVICSVESQGQITPRTRTARLSEQSARAGWQPARPVATFDASPSTSGVASTNRLRANTATAGRTAVRMVGGQVPTPPSDSAISIVEPGQTRVIREGEVIQGEIIQGEVIDGQIIEGPFIEGEYIDGQIIDGQIIDSQIIDGEIIDGQIIHGELLDGRIVGGPMIRRGLRIAPRLRDSGCDSIGGCDGSCDGGCDGIPCDSCGSSCCGELCSTEAWRPCITLCLPQDGWVSYEYLNWYQDALELPALVTTSIDSSVSRSQAGVLSSPMTSVLYGNEGLLGPSIDGGRLRFGVWLDRCHTWGIGAEFFGMSTQTDEFSAASDGLPILARPFFNTLTGLEDAELVAYPDVVSGSLNIQVESSFEGAGFQIRNLRRTEEGCREWWFCGCPEHFCCRSELLYGYRFLQLSEGVTIQESLVSQDQSNPGTFDITDRFRTRNQFNGVDLGWSVKTTRGHWTMDGAIRLAIGNTRQTVSISGVSQISDPSSIPTDQTHDSGFLALDSNSGEYSQNEFSIVPEFGVNLGYQMTDHLRFLVGYTGIYWSNVVRPGHHIDRDVNPNLLPPVGTSVAGTNRPRFAFDTTDYWIQGISLGGEYRW